MNYRYISLFLIVSPALAMEQGALFVQKTALKTVPSLQEFALRSYAKALCENAPKEVLSDAQVVDWGKEHGLENFFDLELGDSLPKLKKILAEPMVNAIIKTDLKCPKIFSPDGQSEFIDDWRDKTQYIVHTDKQRSVYSITSMGVRFECGSDHYGRWPTFSPDARWMVGWEKEKRATLVLIPRALNLSRTEVSLATRGDYAFLDADTILLRADHTIFVSNIADLVLKGTEALKAVYYRNDMQEYPLSLFFRTIYALSNSYIACVGPYEKSIEILNRGADGLFSPAKIVKIPNISIGSLVVHKARGVAALHSGPAHTTVHLYQLLGDEAGEVSTIEVQYLENYVFSPCGNYLACGTNFKRQVVEIFDCKNLASPQLIQVTPQVVEEGAAECMIWTDQMLIVCDGHGKQHHITFNNAAPLVARYAAYRKKLEEKEKETNKNAS